MGKHQICDRTTGFLPLWKQTETWAEINQPTCTDTRVFSEEKKDRQDESSELASLTTFVYGSFLVDVHPSLFFYFT